MRHSKLVRFSTAPTGGGESVYLFFEFTIKSVCIKELLYEGIL